MTTTRTTSRTATNQWKQLRQKIIKDTQNNGNNNCPWCGTVIAWGTHGKPNSPEADHIIPHSMGGQDVYHNLTVLCRTCNRKKGNKKTPPQTNRPIKTSRQW